MWTEFCSTIHSIHPLALPPKIASKNKTTLNILRQQKKKTPFTLSSFFNRLLSVPSSVHSSPSFSRLPALAQHSHMLTTDAELSLSPHLFTMVASEKLRFVCHEMTQCGTQDAENTVAHLMCLSTTFSALRNGRPLSFANSLVKPSLFFAHKCWGSLRRNFWSGTKVCDALRVAIVWASN